MKRHDSDDELNERDRGETSEAVETIHSLSARAGWAPMVMYLGPCFADKKTHFGMPMDHISYRDNPGLYETVPLDSAVQIWNSSAHEGTLKELKQKVIFGTSVLARLESEGCVEQRLCTLYFTQKISRKELKEQIAEVFNDEELLDAFFDALQKMKMDKIYCKMNSTVQIFIPEAVPALSAASKKKVKWALKYNSAVVSFDEGNLLSDAYDVEEALFYACKYQRRVRIARWGAEIPDVSLSELLYRALVSFLQSGRYISCRHVAQCYSYAQSRALNALQHQATAEDFAFDYGYELDKEGFVTRVQSLTSPSALTSAGPRSFSLLGLFRPKQYAAQHAPVAAVSTSRRRSSFLGGGGAPRGTAGVQGTLSPEYQAMARQVALELGIEDRDRAVPSALDEDGAVRVAAVAARNAVRKRQPTNWKTFLNYKPNAPGTSQSSKSFTLGVSLKGGRTAQRRNSGSSTTSSVPSAKRSFFDLRREDPRPKNENGSYSYGLNKAARNGNDLSASISTADVKASKASAKGANTSATPKPAPPSTLEETIAVKKMSVYNLMTVVRSHASSLCEEDLMVPQLPAKVLPDKAPVQTNTPQKATMAVTSPVTPLHEPQRPRAAPSSVTFEPEEQGSQGSASGAVTPMDVNLSARSFDSTSEVFGLLEPDSLKDPAQSVVSAPAATEPRMLSKDQPTPQLATETVSAKDQRFTKTRETVQALLMAAADSDEEGSAVVQADRTQSATSMYTAGTAAASTSSKSENDGAVFLSEEALTNHDSAVGSFSDPIKPTASVVAEQLASRTFPQPALQAQSSDRRESDLTVPHAPVSSPGVRLSSPQVVVAHKKSVEPSALQRPVSFVQDVATDQVPPPAVVRQATIALPEPAQAPVAAAPTKAELKATAEAAKAAAKVAAEAAHRAEADALKAKQAELKLARQQREMKRMRTAVALQPAAKKVVLARNTTLLPAEYQEIVEQLQIGLTATAPGTAPATAVSVGVQRLQQEVRHPAAAAAPITRTHPVGAQRPLLGALNASAGVSTTSIGSEESGESPSVKLKAKAIEDKVQKSKLLLQKYSVTQSKRPIM